MGTTLQVAAIGSSGENKTRLINLINSYTYRRKYDGAEFQFVAKDCSDANDSLFKEFQYVIVIHDYEDKDSANDAFLMIRNVCKTFCEPQLRICSVITNHRKDLSELDFLDTRFRARQLVSLFNIQTISLCHGTGEGLDDLARHIADAVHPQLPQRKYLSLDGTWNRIWNWILDSLSKILALPLPKNVNEDTADLLELDDTKVTSLVRSPLAKQWDLSFKRLMGLGGSIRAHKITPTLLAKNLSASEVATLRLLRKHTTIPVPQPRYAHLQKWLVMDFIEGEMLHDCWSSLSFFMKLRVACTLRGYIGQLRRLRGVVPGRLEDGIVSSIHSDYIELGPFKSATHFRFYCEFIAQYSWNCTVKYRDPAKPLPHPPMFGDDWDLVLTHADLNLTNLLLADDGVLWVIDWGNSGYYPKWMESLTMKRYDGMYPKTWNDLRWLISGSFPDYELFWQYVENKMGRFRRPRVATKEHS